jgi:hypothetical protein
MARLFFLAAAMLLSTPATAYIGPGAGISVLGSLLGILATIVVAIGAIVMWPLRKMLKKRRQARAESNVSAASANTPPEADTLDTDPASGDRS